MSEPSLPLLTRLWFAFVCSWRVLLDGPFALRVWSVRDAMPALEPPAPAAKKRADKPKKRSAKKPAKALAAPPDEAPAEPDLSPALVLLSLLQREGRLVDFLEQDVSDFDDAEIGAAVRVVHEGCRKVLHSHAEVLPVRPEDEESRVEVSDGLKSGAIKLTGNLSGEPPYRGVLRHRGWRIRALSLPTPVAGHDPNIIAPAEVEL